MATNRKAVSPLKVGALGKTASKITATKNTPAQARRQAVKFLLISAACRDFLPIGLAEWITSCLGVNHA